MNSFKEIIYKLFHPNTINIHSKWSYPSCALSNFACYDFEVDGVPCKSMEGFLQSLKFENYDFKQALHANKTKKLRHSIGGKNSMETILTEKEFCELLFNSRKIYE